MIGRVEVLTIEFTELWEPESDLLAGISAVEAEKKLFRQARADVERSADVMLTCGLETKSQSQIGTALQVYFNLGLLATKMGQVLSEKIKEVQTCLKDCFDVKKIEAAVFEQLPASAVAKVKQTPHFFRPLRRQKQKSKFLLQQPSRIKKTNHIRFVQKK